MTQLPTGALPVCLNCGERFLPAHTRMLPEVIGFEEPRKQGGTNHIIGRQQTGRVVGPCCYLEVKRHGGLTRQEALL